MRQSDVVKEEVGVVGRPGLGHPHAALRNLQRLRLPTS